MSSHTNGPKGEGDEKEGRTPSLLHPVHLEAVVTSVYFSMRLHRLWSVLSLFVAAAAQTISGLAFDSQDVVSLVWGFEGAISAHYDIWLCAGDESTGEYVGDSWLTSFLVPRSNTKLTILI